PGSPWTSPPAPPRSSQAPAPPSQPAQGQAQRPQGQAQPPHGHTQSPHGQAQLPHGQAQLPLLMPSQPLAPTLVQAELYPGHPPLAGSMSPTLPLAPRDSHPSGEPFAPQFSVGDAAGQVVYSDSSGPPPGFAA